MCTDAPLAAKPMITKEWIAGLEDCLDRADMDGAVIYIAHLQPKTLEQNLDDNLGPLLALRARCLICEVYDYAGMNSEANLCFKQPEEYVEDLERQKSQKAEVWKDINKLAYLKQECLACLHLGMVKHYRKHEYPEAHKLFKLAEEVLLRINSNRSPIPCMGSLARAYYCLGLAEREQYKLHDARRHFSQTVEGAWARILEQQQAGKRVASLKYLIGRALGLGMAWIAFARASMAEANADIVAARLILQETGGVKHLLDYVEVVHACVQRSRALSIGEMGAALKDMKDAYSALGGNDVLRSPGTGGHFIYAQRAACELATSHIYAARLYGRNDEKAVEAFDNHLNQALQYIALVETSLLQSDPDKKDTRTRCNICITRSRIFREMGKFNEAKVEAQKAVKIADNSSFSRVDCWNTLGEAYYHVDEIDEALEQFEKVRNDANAQTNPKVLAISELQIALCHLKQGRVNMAQEIVTRWKSHGSQGRANAFVQYLLHKIESQLSEPPFVIPGNTSDSSLKDWPYRLEKWLADLAFKRADGNKQKTADMLGVVWKTVDTWMKRNTDEFDDAPPTSE